MTTKTAEVRTRVEPKLKKDSNKIFKKLGLNESEGVRLLLKGLVIHNGIPFDFRIPVASEAEQRDIESILDERTAADKKISRSETHTVDL